MCVAISVHCYVHERKLREFACLSIGIALAFMWDAVVVHPYCDAKPNVSVTSGMTAEQYHGLVRESMLTQLKMKDKNNGM